MKKYLYSTFVLILLGFLSATLYAPNDTPSTLTKELAIGARRKVSGTYTDRTATENAADWTAPPPLLNPLLVPNNIIIAMDPTKYALALDPEITGSDAGVVVLRTPVRNPTNHTITSDIWAKQASSGGYAPIPIGGGAFFPGYGNWQKTKSFVIVKSNTVTVSQTKVTVERGTAMDLTRDTDYDYSGITWRRFLFGPPGETVPSIYSPVIASGKRIRGWVWQADHYIPILNQWFEPVKGLNGCECREEVPDVPAMAFQLGDINDGASIDPVGRYKLLDEVQLDVGNSACADWISGNQPPNALPAPPATGNVFTNQQYSIFAAGWLVGTYTRNVDIVSVGGALILRIRYSTITPVLTDAWDVPTIPPDWDL